MEFRKVRSRRGAFSKNTKDEQTLWEIWTPVEQNDGFMTLGGAPNAAVGGGVVQDLPVSLVGLPKVHGSRTVVESKEGRRISRRKIVPLRYLY